MPSRSRAKVAKLRASDSFASIEELQKLYPTLRTISDVADFKKQQKELTKMSNPEFKTLCKCIHGFVHKKKPFNVNKRDTKRAGSLLKPYKEHLNQFLKKQSLKKRRALVNQTGRGIFIPMLISALAPVVTSLIEKAIKKK